MVYCGKMTKNEGEGRWFTVGNEREDNGIDYTVALLIILILLLPFSSVVQFLVLSTTASEFKHWALYTCSVVH